MSIRLWEAYQRLRQREKAQAVLGIPYDWRRRGMFEGEYFHHMPWKLRHVGNVIPERRRGDIWWWAEKRNIECYGWHLDPESLIGRDGEDMVWGVVYQLPSKLGFTRLIAGYEVGGSGLVTLDRTMMWEEKGDHNYHTYQLDIAREAARHADGLAERYADEEREYRLGLEEEDEE